MRLFFSTILSMEIVGLRSPNICQGEQIITLRTITTQRCDVRWNNRQGKQEFRGFMRVSLTEFFSNSSVNGTNKKHFSSKTAWKNSFLHRLTRYTTLYSIFNLLRRLMQWMTSQIGFLMKNFKKWKAIQATAEKCVAHQLQLVLNNSLGKN